MHPFEYSFMMHRSSIGIIVSLIKSYPWIDPQDLGPDALHHRHRSGRMHNIMPWASDDVAVDRSKRVVCTSAVATMDQCDIN